MAESSTNISETLEELENSLIEICKVDTDDSSTVQYSNEDYDDMLKEILIQCEEVVTLHSEPHEAQDDICFNIQVIVPEDVSDAEVNEIKPKNEWPFRNSHLSRGDEHFFRFAQWLDETYFQKTLESTEQKTVEEPSPGSYRKSDCKEVEEESSGSNSKLDDIVEGSCSLVENDKLVDEAIADLNCNEVVQYHLRKNVVTSRTPVLSSDMLLDTDSAISAANACDEDDIPVICLSASEDKFGPEKGSNEPEDLVILPHHDSIPEVLADRTPKLERLSFRYKWQTEVLPESVDRKPKFETDEAVCTNSLVLKKEQVCERHFENEDNLRLGGPIAEGDRFFATFGKSLETSEDITRRGNAQQSISEEHLVMNTEGGFEDMDIAMTDDDEEETIDWIKEGPDAEELNLQEPLQSLYGNEVQSLQSYSEDLSKNVQLKTEETLRFEHRSESRKPSFGSGSLSDKFPAVTFEIDFDNFNFYGSFLDSSRIECPIGSPVIQSGCRLNDSHFQRRTGSLDDGYDCDKGLLKVQQKMEQETLLSQRDWTETQLVDCHPENLDSLEYPFCQRDFITSNQTFLFYPQYPAVFGPSVPLQQNYGFAYSKDDVLNCSRFYSFSKDISGPSVSVDDGHLEDVSSSTSSDFVHKMGENEMRDNSDPGWRVMELLDNDDERYKYVRVRWLNCHIANPNQNLTTHNYRKRREGSRNADVLAQNGKRKIEDFESQRSSKRLRKCTAYYDDQIRNLRRKRSEARPSKRIDRKRYQEHGRKLDAHQLKMLNDQRSRDMNLDNEIQKLMKNRDELKTFQKYYSGLRNSSTAKMDTTLITDEQFEEIMSMEKLYQMFDKYYDCSNH